MILWLGASPLEKCTLLLDRRLRNAKDRREAGPNKNYFGKTEGLLRSLRDGQNGYKRAPAKPFLEGHGTV